MPHRTRRINAAAVDEALRRYLRDAGELHDDDVISQELSFVKIRGKLGDDGNMTPARRYMVPSLPSLDLDEAIGLLEVLLADLKRNQSVQII